MEYIETRAADRKKMAAELESLIVAAGATFERREGDPYPGARCIRLNVTAARGLGVSIDIDGDSCQPGVYVLAWCISTDSDACLADRFGVGGVGEVNPHHFQKSTQVAYGFESLKANIARGLAMAADGSAFDAAREATSIEKNGTAADGRLIWDFHRQREAGEVPDAATCIAQAEALERAAPRWTREPAGHRNHRPDIAADMRQHAAELRAHARARAA